MNRVDMAEYRAWQEKCSVVFAPQFRSSDYDKIETLEEGFTVISTAYEKIVEVYRVLASENELRDSGGQVVYTWRNLNIDGAFCHLFRHENGCRYLVFRRDLYGYSVYELESGREFHYIPSQRETFIWTDAHYDPASGLLAVAGCFWAAPFSVIVLDFTDPLQKRPEESWLDVHEIVDPEWIIYEDIDYVGWNGDMLELRALHGETGKYENLSLSAQTLREKVNAMQVSDCKTQG